MNKFEFHSDFFRSLNRCDIHYNFGIIAIRFIYIKLHTSTHWQLSLLCFGPKYFWGSSRNVLWLNIFKLKHSSALSLFSILTVQFWNAFQTTSETVTVVFLPVGVHLNRPLALSPIRNIYSSQVWALVGLRINVLNWTTFSIEFKPDRISWNGMMDLYRWR